VNMRLSDQNLRGRTVIASDGLAIGEVGLLFLDSDALRVESLQVKLRKEVADRLGATRTLFHAGALEIPMRLVTIMLAARASLLHVVEHGRSGRGSSAGGGLDAVGGAGRGSPPPSTNASAGVRGEAPSLVTAGDLGYHAVTASLRVPNDSADLELSKGWHRA
jgi:sporulation protein YlmC with PRC-barrel domain